MHWSIKLCLCVFLSQDVRVPFKAMAIERTVLLNCTIFVIFSRFDPHKCFSKTLEKKAINTMKCIYSCGTNSSPIQVKS
jgi:hypothetical protein